MLALIYSGAISDEKSKKLVGSGGDFGPLVVTEKNSSYEVTVSNFVPLYKWSYVEVEVLDKNKKHLFSFGDGMWHEAGVDDEGSWVESNTNYSMDITFKEIGEYYFKIISERNDGEGNPIYISVVQKRGSSVAFITLGILSFIAAGAAYYFSTQVELNEESVRKSKTVLIVLLVIFFIGALFYSMRGWGYMGYYGYGHGPSFFYMGGPSIYHSPSTREGSISGTGQRGGGFGAGK